MGAAYLPPMLPRVLCPLPRTSLACAGRMDLMEAVDQHDLKALSKELPL